MVPTARYADLATALADRGTTLLTSPDRYTRAHELPGWYPTFAAVTPHSVWYPLDPGQVPTTAELAGIIAPLGGGRAVIKDYVKSRKHEWHDACYIPDLRDLPAVHRVVGRMVQLHGEWLSGGLVVRAFEDFATGPDAGEARVWWLDGQPVLTGPHPDTPHLRPAPDLAGVQPAVAGLGCRFVTTDLARRVDGRWRVVEVGDGQVSDRPATTDPAELVTPLLTAPPPPGS